jgi:hypothetical protein
MHVPAEPHLVWGSHFTSNSLHDCHYITIEVDISEHLQSLDPDHMCTRENCVNCATFIMP